MSLPTIVSALGDPDLGADTQDVPAAVSAEGEAAVGAPSTRDCLVHGRRDELLATIEGRHRYAEYLAGLELNGFTKQSAMAAHVTHELRRLAPHLTAEDAAFWLGELAAALVWRQKVRDGDYDTAMCGHDRQRMWDGACADVDEALHELAGAAADTTQGGPA